MAITVRCAALTWYDAAKGQYQRCDHAWEVPDGAAGSTVECPVCGSATPVSRPPVDLRAVERRRQDEDALEVLPFPDEDGPAPAAAAASPPPSRPAAPAPSRPAPTTTALRPATPRPDTPRPDTPRAAAPRPAAPGGPRPRTGERTPGPAGRGSPTGPDVPTAPRPRPAAPSGAPAKPAKVSGPPADFYGQSERADDGFTLAPAAEVARTGDPLFADLPVPAGPAAGTTLAAPAPSASWTLPSGEPTTAATGGRCPKCGGAVHEGLCGACGYHVSLGRFVKDFKPTETDAVGLMRTMEAHVQGVPPRAALAWAAAAAILLGLCVVFFLWLATPYSFVLTLPAVAAVYGGVFVSGLRRADGAKVFDAWTAVLAVQRIAGWRAGTKWQPVTVVTRHDRGFSDADLDDLEDWYDVEALDLAGTSITDRGLASLVAMPRLIYLVVRDTPVTEQAVVGFQKRRPKLWVWR